MFSQGKLMAQLSPCLSQLWICQTSKAKSSHWPW